jgi:hypothetical protein
MLLALLTPSTGGASSFGCATPRVLDSDRPQWPWIGTSCCGGVTLSVAALGTALSARAIEAAPVGLAGSLAKAAWTSAGAGHGTALSFLKHMMTSKFGVGVASAVVLAGAVGLAWSLRWPWWPAKPPPLALNGTWTRLDKPQPLGHIVSGECFALDPDGQLYVPEPHGVGIQKRDRDGHWSLVAPEKPSPGVLRDLACDGSGNLYVAEQERIPERDRAGHWTILATWGKELGQVFYPQALAVDHAGNLYVADQGAESGKILLKKPIFPEMGR